MKCALHLRGSGVYPQAAEMTQKLSAVNRWCVTGTPVQRNLLGRVLAPSKATAKYLLMEFFFFAD